MIQLLKWTRRSESEPMMYGISQACEINPLLSRRLVISLALSFATLATNSLYAQQPQAKPATAEPIVILIGGNHSDPSPGQLAGTAGRGGNSGLWRLKGDLLDREHLPAEYFNWNGTRAGHIDAARPGGAHQIAQFIRQQQARRPQAPVILVGNSWGGLTAWQVCRLLAGDWIEESLGSQQLIDSSGTQPNVPSSSATPQQATSTDAPQTVADAGQSEVIPVELLVLLDPSSLGRSKELKPAVLPANVRHAINYYTHNSFGWRSWLDDSRLTNVDLGDPANGYLSAGGAKYDSAFNWRAHVSAEWDKRIHAAIRREILQSLQTAADSLPSGAVSTESLRRRRE